MKDSQFIFSAIMHLLFLVAIVTVILMLTEFPINVILLLLGFGVISTQAVLFKGAITILLNGSSWLIEQLEFLYSLLDEDKKQFYNEMLKNDPRFKVIEEDMDKDRGLH